MAKANDIRPGVEVVLGDYGKATIYPISLRQLRKLNKVLKNLDFESMTDLDDATIDQMVEAAAIALEKVVPELSEDKEKLEDVVDIKAFNQLIAAAMGADPNELAGMTKAG